MGRIFGHDGNLRAVMGVYFQLLRFLDLVRCAPSAPVDVTHAHCAPAINSGHSALMSSNSSNRQWLMPAACGCQIVDPGPMMEPRCGQVPLLQRVADFGFPPPPDVRRGSGE
jgi:hypothetical protein